MTPSPNIKDSAKTETKNPTTKKVKKVPRRDKSKLFSIIPRIIDGIIARSDKKVNLRYFGFTLHDLESKMRLNTDDNPNTKVNPIRREYIPI